MTCPFWPVLLATIFTYFFFTSSLFQIDFKSPSFSRYTRFLCYIDVWTSRSTRYLFFWHLASLTALSWPPQLCARLLLAPSHRSFYRPCQTTLLPPSCGSAHHHKLWLLPMNYTDTTVTLKSTQTSHRPWPCRQTRFCAAWSLITNHLSLTLETASPSGRDRRPLLWTLSLPSSGSWSASWTLQTCGHPHLARSNKHLSNPTRGPYGSCPATACISRPLRSPTLLRPSSSTLLLFNSHLTSRSCYIRCLAHHSSSSPRSALIQQPLRWRLYQTLARSSHTRTTAPCSTTRLSSSPALRSSPGIRSQAHISLSLGLLMRLIPKPFSGCWPRF